MSTLLERERRSVLSEVDDFDYTESIIGSPPDPICMLSGRHPIQAPQMGPEWVIFTQDDCPTGTVVEYFVPYTGDGNLFRYCPSQYSSEAPRAEVAAGQLIFTIIVKEFDGNAVKAEFEHERAKVRQWLVGVQKDVDGFNASLTFQVERAIEARSQRLLDAEGVAQEQV